MTEDATTSPQDSALRPAGSDLHPADPVDDLTGNTTAGATPPAPPSAAPEEGGLAGGDPPDLPRDRRPGDGSVAHDRPDEPDAMRTAHRPPEAASPAD